MEETSFQSLEQSPAPSIPRSRKGPPVLIPIIIILVVAVFGVNKLFFSKKTGEEPIPTPTEEITETESPIPTSIPQDSPTPTKKPTPTPTITPTPKPTTNPVDKETGLDRSKLSIEVLNGSGVAGTAGKARDLLKDLGYNVTSVGNADNFDYEKTVIEVKSAKSDYLPLLKKDLSQDYSFGTTSAALSTTASADARVIVGKQ